MWSMLRIVPKAVLYEKIRRSQKAPNYMYQVQGTQNKAYMKKKNKFIGSPKGRWVAWGTRAP